MSKAHLPPVPPASRSDKGPGADPQAGQGAITRDEGPRTRDLSKQGRQGNIKQNTTHKGYQQDR